MTLLQTASNITAAAFVAASMIPVAMLAQAGDGEVRSRDRHPQHVLSMRLQSVAPPSETSLFVTHKYQSAVTAE